MKTFSTLAAAAVIASAAIAAPAPAEAARGRNAALAIIGLAGAAVAGAIIAGSQQPAYAGHPSYQGYHGYQGRSYGDHYAPAPVYRPRHVAPEYGDGGGYGYGYGQGGHVVRQRPRFVEHPPVARCNIVQQPVFDQFGYQIGIRNRRVCY
jgi:hypothetical protein